MFPVLFPGFVSDSDVVVVKGRGLAFSDPKHGVSAIISAFTNQTSVPPCYYMHAA